MSYKKIILILCLGIFLSAERDAHAQVKTVKYSYTGAMQTFTVPSCVGNITIDCYGAQGVPKANENHVGFGGEARGVATVSPGQVYNIFVGGQAAWNGGGLGELGANGGDGSDVRFPGTAIANRIIVAGGGGGSGGDSWSCLSVQTGNGGGGTAVGNNFVGGDGGLGYGGCGTAGGNIGGTGYAGNCHGGGGGGGGLTTGGGGATATCGPYVSANGALGAGGAAFISPLCQNSGEGVGGGGGGYYGGGGAAGYNCGAGEGGGGSSWTGTLASPFFSTGSWTGNGQIIITYVTDSVGSAKGNVISNIICSGNLTGAASILVNNVAGGPAFSYSWTPNVSSSDTATGLSAGTYNVIVTGCGSATATVTITQPGFFATNPTVNEIQCYGGTGSIIAGAVGGTLPYTFVFTPGGHVNSIVNLPVGSYSLNVLDNRGCASSDLITISQPNPIAVSAYAVDSVACYGQSNGRATASVSGGTFPYTYLWTPSNQTSIIANNLTAANYTLNVTDNHGCVGKGSVPITQPAQLIAIVKPALNNLLCYGDNNGVLGSDVNGGIRPYTYLWSNGGGTDSIAGGLSAGNYSLTLTDGHGCVTVVPAIITQPAQIVLSIDSTFNSGTCDGTAWVILNGGVQPYTYLWSNGSTNYYQNNLCNGLYCCTVTDANGCIHDICTHIKSDLGVGGLSVNSDKITVYPNPNNGLFTIQSSVSGQAQVEIYNVLGEKVFTSNLSTTNANTINMSNQPNGVYLYRVISIDNGSLISEGKVVLEK